MKKCILFLPLVCFHLVWGQYWHPLGSGTNGSIVNALAHDSVNSLLYLGGNFTQAGGNLASNFATWNGTQFAPVGAGADNQIVTLSFIDGMLYAGGEFLTLDTVTASPCIARYNGTNWEPIGQGFFKTGLHSFSTSVKTIVKYKNDIYAAGIFDQADGLPCNYISRWDGATWRTLGAGTAGTAGVYEMHVYNGDLYVGGGFTAAGGVASTSYIARWDSTTWSSVGGATNGTVSSMVILNNELYAAGGFTTIAGIAANRVAKFDGSNWSALGSGLNLDVTSMAVFRGELYVGGVFSQAGGVAANRVAKWNGTTWSAVGLGMDNLIFDFEEDATNDVLYACGSFTTADALTVNHIAMLSDVVAIDGPTFTNLRVFPQPASDEITFDFSSFNNASAIEFRIIDLMGKELLHLQKVKSAQLRLDLTTFPAGIYFAQFNENGKVNSVRFIKQ